jgi:hypothetical protein
MTTTSDPPSEDLETAAKAIQGLLDTMQAIRTPHNGQRVATEVVPQRRTYANAAREAATRTQSVDHAASDPRRKKPNPKPRSHPPPPDKTSAPPATRLIVRLSGPLKRCPHPSQIRSAINKELPPQTRVAGANFSRAGNIVLHTLADTPASLLAEHSEVIAKTLFRELGVEPMSFDVGERWHHVVCHQVPVPGNRRECLSEEIGRELSVWNRVEGGGKDYVSSLALCQKEALSSKNFITVKITLKKEESVQRLRSHGVFLFGSYCRVATYRQRRAVI